MRALAVLVGIALVVGGLAIALGVRTVVYGIVTIDLAVRMWRAAADADHPRRRWPMWLRLAVTALALALGGAAISVAGNRAHPGDPGRSTPHRRRCPTVRRARFFAATSSTTISTGRRRTGCCTCRPATTASRRL